MTRRSDRGRRPRPADADQAAKFCDQLGDGDGIDPRDEAKAKLWRRRGPDCKTLQLCAAVARTVEQLLSGECGDPLLAGCRVQSVAPAPNAGRLLVTVVTGDPPDEVANRLRAATGFLRSQVATSVHRRKAPDLAFAVVAEAVDA